MIVFNFTGLKRFYWRPSVERKRDRELWFVAIRWLGVEVVAYSITMGTEFIRRLNRETRGVVTQ